MQLTLRDLYSRLRTLLRPTADKAGTPGEEVDLVEAVKHARGLQKVGYDVTFTFLPRFPDAPPMHICIGRTGDDAWQGGGHDMHSRGIALRKALSEVIERSIWKNDVPFWKEGSIVSSMKGLSEPHLDLRRLSGLSSRQRARMRGFSFDASTPFRWSCGISLANGKPVWIPAQLVSGRYARECGGEPNLREPNTNGIATGSTFEEAAHRGLLELIERDAFMITFFNKISPPRIRHDSVRDERSRALLSAFERFGLTCDILHLPTDIPVTVVAAILRDPTGIGPAFALGARARHDTEDAIHGALVEMYTVWSLARFLGAYRRELPKKDLDLTQRVAYWAKAENAPKISWLTEGPMIEAPAPSPANDLHRLMKAMAASGCDAAAIDMSPPHLKRRGVHAVYVVSPELQPVNFTDTPYLGGTRLRSVAERCGYTALDAPPPYLHPFP